MMLSFRRATQVVIRVIIFLLCSVSISHAAADTQTIPERYKSLLSNNIISDAIIWQGSSSVISYYDMWTNKQKAQLIEAIMRLETDEPYPMQNPPQLKDDKYISDQDAWTIYISHVAHSLWLEANHLVNWSILDYTQKELALLLDSRQLIRHNLGKPYFDIDTMGDVTDWNVEISYQFMKDNEFIKDDPASTIYAFAGWIRNNVFHYFCAPDVYQKFWRYSGPPPVDRILYPVTRIYNKGYSFSAGCWGTTGLFSAVLRSVNIPTQYTYVKLQTPGDKSSGLHSTVTFPTVGIGLTHSDDLYGAMTGLLKWWGDRVICDDDVIPTEKLFHSTDWLDAHIFNPKVLDRGDNHQNSKGEQALFNADKYTSDLAIEYLTDYLLYNRATDSSQKAKPMGLTELLQGASVGGDVYYYAKNFFSDEEMSSIVQKVDDELIRIGDGDWVKGASIVRRSGKPIIIDLASENRSLQLTATLSADALRQKITWSSSNKSIATVSDEGIISGLRNGIVTITATAADGFRTKATRKVSVTYYAKEIKISGDATVASGKKTTLKAEVLPEETVNKRVLWESSDTDVATVNAKGVVTAKKVTEEKTVIIKATAKDGSGIFMECVITVMPAK